MKTTLGLESKSASARNDRYVGSIIEQKQVKTAAMTNVLQRAWERLGGIKITEATDRVVLFDFENWETQKKIDI